MQQYKPPSYPKAPGPDSPEGYQAQFSWWDNAQKVARAEAERLSERLPPELKEKRIQSDEQVILRRLTEPTYQCRAGHFFKIPDGSVPLVCGRCGEDTVDACDCGALVALQYAYKPPWKTCQASREFCDVCSHLYPWAARYLYRPQMKT